MPNDYSDPVYKNESNNNPPPRQPFKKNTFNNNFNFNNFKPGKIKLFITYIILLFIYSFIALPVLNPIYQSSYFFVLINIFIIVLIFFYDKIFSSKRLRRYFSIAIIAVVLLYVGLIILSSPIVRSDSYYNLIGDVETVKYNPNKTDIHQEKTPVVDYDLAKKLGDKVLGKESGLGSQFTVGDYYLISTPDDIAWVAPLEPTSFLKWLQNREGSPGYIYVSATNPNDVRLVQDINGKPIHIKYSQDSYFLRNVRRHAYLQGNETRGMTDYSFEIDDEGNPYWVISTFKPFIGFSGVDTSGIITVNAQTGESTYYDVNDKDIPKWVDRIYPKDMIQDQLNYYGAYKNGWLNTVTTQKDQIQTTDGISYIFVDNKPYYYTGMTSVQNDESTVGFMVTDIMNKKTTFYKLNGATETAAQKSAEGQVQQYNYSASNPILMTIYNKPTYFMTLKDKDGLVKQYAYVSVENYNVVGIGSSLQSAQRDYYSKLQENDLLDSSELNTKEINGTVDRINYIDNKYYIKLDNDDTLFTVTPDISNQLPLTQKGDNVSISYLPTDDEYQNIAKFENKSL